MQDGIRGGISHPCFTQTVYKITGRLLPPHRVFIAIAIDPHRRRATNGNGHDEQIKLDLKLVDKVIGITNEEAISTARRLMEEEGILAGISSGAAVAAALKLQEDESFTNKNIVVILPSSGERYLSTALFADLFTEKELQQ